MKKYFLILITSIAVILTSCTTHMMYSLNAECDISKEELFGNIASMLVKNGFSVTVSDLKLGYLQGDMIIEDPEYGNIRRVWTFQLEGNKLIATAKGIRSASLFLNFSVRYFYDNNIKDANWYWDVRNAIGKLCHNLVFIESEQK